MPRLNISSLEDAKRFVETYGYDMEDGRDNANAWQIYRFALEIHKEFVLEEGEETPEVFQNEEKLGKLGHLLIRPLRRIKIYCKSGLVLF